jgi:hypothetical protein
MKRFITSLLVAVLGTLFVGVHASATPPSPTAGLTIEPYLRNVSITSDTIQQSFSFTLTNRTKYAAHLQLKPVDLGSLTDTGGLVFAGANTSTFAKNHGLAGWLQVAQPEITIGSGQTSNIVTTVHNTAALSPGGHYAAVLITTADEPRTQSQVTIKQTLSPLIFLNKLGGDHFDLRLKSIERDGNIFRLPKNVTLNFQNPGNTHVVPRGTVKLIGNKSHVVAQGTINEDSAFVLPDMSRKLPLTLTPVSKRSAGETNYHLEVDYRYDGLGTFAVKNIPVRYSDPVRWFLIASGIILLGAYMLFVRHVWGIKFNLKNVSAQGKKLHTHMRAKLHKTHKN